MKRENNNEDIFYKPNRNWCWVYAIKSKLNGELYFGSTNDLRKRLKDHNDGKVMSTSRYKPWILLYYEAYKSEKLAKDREKKIKQHGNAKRELVKRAGLKENKKNGAGFTLIELLIVFGILVIVSALSIPFIQSFQTSSDLYTYSNTVTQTLRRAQQQAIAGQSNSGWGVYFDNGGKKLILFKGENYASRDQTYDQITDYPEIFSISAGFGDEVYFAIYSGKPSVSGDVTIISPNEGDKVISINSIGLIQINE